MKPIPHRARSGSILKQIDRYLKRELARYFRTPDTYPVLISMLLLFVFWKGHGFRVRFFFEHSWFLPALFLVCLFDTSLSWLLVRCLLGSSRRKSGGKMLLVFVLNSVKTFVIWIYFIIYGVDRVLGRT